MTAIGVASPEGLAFGGLRRLRVAGPLTAATAPALRRRLRDEVGIDDVRLLLDLRAVTALDAVGLAVLIDASRLIDARPGGVVKVLANPLVIRAFKDSGTMTAFKIWNG
jgi:anti-anti-sigma factor